jgi:tetratricopeptide (TPR) repeat protein
VRIRSQRPAAPNVELELMARGRGVPVPVVEMDARWLGVWASLVAGGRNGWVLAAAMFTRDAPSIGARLDAEAGDGSGREAQERVNRFRSAASPGAFDLARHLAAAPLTLPVMRLVQRVMLPRSPAAYLADIFLGDILRRVGPDTLDPETAAYDFHKGVRELLLALSTRTETLTVLREVSAFLAARLGAAFDFRALLGSGPAEIPELAPPFARVVAMALRALGGHYAEISEKLSAAEDTRSAGQLLLAEDGPKEDSRTRVVRHVETRGADVSLPGAEDLTERPHQQQPIVWGGVPPRNPNFTGREELLLDLHARLQGHVTAVLPHALHGMGGVGKTQLAIEYAYRFATDYDLVWWVPAAELSLIRPALADLASRLDRPAGGDLTQRIQGVLEALRQGQPYSRWLLIFDNADNPDDVQPYLPYPSGHLLLTSRNQAWLAAAQTLEVDVFSRGESIRLIQTWGPSIREREADRLAEALGDLPVAVEQAAAWLVETGTSVDEYLRLLQDRIGELLREKPRNYPQALTAAWQLAFERLAKEAPAAAQLLDLCAFFGPEPIPVRLLSAGRHVRDLPSPLADAVGDEIALGRTVRDVCRYALAHIEPTRRNLQVHRLVQGVLRERLSTEERAERLRLVHAMLAAANPGAPDDPKNADMLADVAGHVRSTRLIEAETPEARQVVIDQIRYLYVLGDYEGSRELGEAAVASWRARYGPDEGQTLIAMHHLANACRAVGMLSEARELNSAALERMQEVFGQEHEYTLRTANSYGGDLRNAGEYARARDLDLEYRPLHQRVFGNDHLYTLRSANNLAVDLRLAGDYGTALALDEEILHRRQTVLGVDHPDTLYAYAQICRDLRGAGDYPRALRLHRQTLPVQASKIGENHLNVLSSRLSYAGTLRRAGELDEACTEAQRCLEGFRQAFGERHAGVLASMSVLADTLRLLGSAAEATAMSSHMYELAEEIYEDGHLFRALYAHNHAIDLRARGSLPEALRLEQEALSGYQDVLLDVDHPDTLSVQAGLAASHAALGNAAAARPLSENTLERSRRKRGRDHPLTLFCLHDLALDQLASGQDASGRQSAAEALEGLRRILGSDHPEVMVAAASQRIEFAIQPPAV